MTQSRATWLAAPLALVLAMAVGLAACGGDDGEEGASVEDVKACLEEKGFKVSEGEPSEELGKSGSLHFSKGAEADLDTGEITLPKGGSISFFETEEDAESRASLQADLAGKTNLGEGAGHEGRAAFRYETEEAKTAIEECL